MKAVLPSVIGTAGGWSGGRTWAKRFPWIILVLALLITFIGYRSEVAAGENLANVERRLALDEIENSVRRPIDRQVDDLLAINGLFAASQQVSGREFSDFIEESKMFARVPALRTVAWAPVVLRSDAAEFVQAVRADVDIVSDFSIRSDQDRPWMTVIRYVEPIDGNEADLGFDLTSDPTRLAAVNLARGTGQVTATETIELVRNGESTTGMSLIAPRFDSDSVVDDGFVGVSLSVFDLDALLETSTAGLTGFVLSEAGNAQDEGAPEFRAIYRSVDVSSSSEHVREMRIAGRSWVVALADGAIEPPSSLRILLAMIPRIVTILVVVWALRTLASARFQAEEQAQELTLELREKNRELAQSNEWLASFTRVASHDLRSPLRAVNSLVGFIREDSTTLDEGAVHNLGRIEERVHRMNALIDDLLILSRISGESEPPARINYAALTSEILSTVEVPRGFTVETAFEGDESAALTATQFKTCVYNLIDNAIKHHDRDDGVISISFSGRRNDVVVTIRDDGPGIAERYLDAIFEPFRRLRPDDDSPGSGIGLTTLLRTADRNGGTISAMSIEGEGSTFELRWPVNNAVSAVEAVVAVAA